MADVPGNAQALGLSGLVRSIHEIDSSITDLQHLLRVSISSPSDPRRPKSVHSLASKQLRRYTLSGKREDLDKAIFYFTESALLPPISWLQHGALILDTFFLLATSLFLRAYVYEQPNDAIYATKYLHHLRDQPHNIPSTTRHNVTTVLVVALYLQVKLEAGNVTQNIREMVLLCRELITLEMSDVDLDFDITDLALLIHPLVLSKFDLYVPDQPLDETIEFLRVARKHRPDLVEHRMAFAVALAYRYSMTCTNDDYDEAASILDEIITCRSPGNSQDKSESAEVQAQGFATGIAAVLAMMRSETYETPEHLEEVIDRIRTCLNSSSYKESSSSVVLDPEATAERRLYYFGSIEGVEEYHSLRSQQVTEMLDRDQTLSKMKDLLFGIRNDDDTTKINEAIKKGKDILASSSSILTLYLFGDILEEAFDRTKKIEYLNELIGVHRQAIEASLSQVSRIRASHLLSHLLLVRFRLFPVYCTRDLDEALELLSQYVSNSHTNLPHRFWYACYWAFTARLYRHPSVSTAYETALSLIHDTLLFAPTLQLQHSTLATRAITHSLPLEYASYRVDQHQLGEAIETLERGRALLWSEMRHFRAPIDQLLVADPHLGHKFAEVNRGLEELTKSVPPSHKLGMPVDDGASDDLRGADQFGRLVLKQRALLKERNEVITQIQALPGFDTFLASPPFDTLRSAASSGPVIIINHSMWRSDILILLHNMPPSLISTPVDFVLRAYALKDMLLDSRLKHGLDSSRYDEALAFVLAQLYTLVGRPVIDRLRQLQVPEQSRIWWYPTSVFCSLPLHAMGPIPSEDGETRYFLDLYVCSYTPTLSALIQSRDPDSSSQTSDRPSILLVAQPDPSLPTVGGEIQAVQALDTEVTSLLSEDATPATVIDAFHCHRFIHFACHGTLEVGKPFEAGFELHGDKRLTLLKIVRAHLPTAEFAFLSACHTAEITEGSAMDEVLHLAAAVQYCGFRSVVGTTWAMLDEDGPDLAKYFYKALFSNPRQDQGLPYHERSAEALQFAVKRLRRKRHITLERWVNFVHYGA